MPCPNGASCVGTNTPLSLDGWWHSPGDWGAFFKCPPGACLAESRTVNGGDDNDNDGDGAGAGGAGDDPSSRAAAARRLAALSDVLTAEDLDFLGSLGGNCSEGRTGPVVRLIPCSKIDRS